MARQELEHLLSENTRDTVLLLQLSKLAESEADMIAAVKYQEQLTKLAPSSETEYRLATLLTRAGDNQEAAAILVRLAAKEEDKEKLLRNIDSLLASQQEETALAILEPKLRETPGDWELVYRQGVAFAHRGNTAAASECFQSLLRGALADDELSTAAKNRQKNATPQKRQPCGALRPQGWRLDSTYELRRAVGLEADNMFFGSSGPHIWMPSDFGLARMACAGWLYRFAEQSSQTDAFLANWKKVASGSAATPRGLWDWIYLQAVREDDDDVFVAARMLCERGRHNRKAAVLDEAGHARRRRRRLFRPSIKPGR